MKNQKNYLLTLLLFMISSYAVWFGGHISNQTPSFERQLRSQIK